MTGRLQQVLRRGDFALTAETTPPDAGTAAPVVEAPPEDVVLVVTTGVL